MLLMLLACQVSAVSNLLKLSKLKLWSSSGQTLVKFLEPRRFDLTWGPIEYHRRSLDNLQTAMKKTRRLCAIMLDTLGREVRID